MSNIIIQYPKSSAAITLSFLVMLSLMINIVVDCTQPEEKKNLLQL